MKDFAWFDHRTQRERLTGFMEERGLTQKEVAGMAGVNERTVRKWMAPEGAKNHRKMCHNTWIAINYIARLPRLSEERDALRECYDAARLMLEHLFYDKNKTLDAIGDMLDAIERIKAIDGDGNE